MPSTAIEPSGGYDFVAFDNVAPKTAATPIVFYTAKSAGTPFGSIDVVNSRLKIDRISEYTGSAKIQFDSDIEFSSTAFRIQGMTSDGSDNASLTLTPTPSAGPTRGAYITLGGNENASTGQLVMYCGNVASSKIEIGTAGTQDIQFVTNGSNRWEIDGSGSTGDLIPSVNGTLNIGSSSFYVAQIAVNTIRSSTTLAFTNQTTSGTAGALNQYWTVTINGSTFKIPCYLTA